MSLNISQQPGNFRLGGRGGITAPLSGPPGSQLCSEYWACWS
nr:MAG TPA: hypothetical protein [Caudoviricetes sp.]